MIVCRRHWYNTPQVDMSFHSDTLSWFRDNSIYLHSLMKLP